MPSLTFLPDAATFAQFAVATFIIALTPGPDMTLFVGRALSEGRAAGMACMAGALTGVLKEIRQAFAERLQPQGAGPVGEIPEAGTVDAGPSASAGPRLAVGEIASREEAARAVPFRKQPGKDDGCAGDGHRRLRP